MTVRRNNRPSPASPTTPGNDVDALVRTTTLRPGLLVGLKTSLVGNVAYSKRDVETSHVTSTGTEVTRWETLRTISDPAEYKRGSTVRLKARSLVSGLCAKTAFGLLYPEANIEELRSAVREARRLVADFNATAQYSRLTFALITGRVAPDDVEAVRAINAEVRELMDTMRRGIEDLNVSAVRDAAARAKSLGQMLTPEAQDRIKTAVESARSAARRLVKAGEQAAQEIDRDALHKITEARTAFLDLDEGTEVRAPEATARALDFEPEAPAPASAPVARRRAAARNVELE